MRLRENTGNFGLGKDSEDIAKEAVRLARDFFGEFKGQARRRIAHKKEKIYAAAFLTIAMRRSGKAVFINEVASKMKIGRFYPEVAVAMDFICGALDIDPGKFTAEDHLEYYAPKVAKKTETRELAKEILAAGKKANPTRVEESLVAVVSAVIFIAMKSTREIASFSAMRRAGLGWSVEKGIGILKNDLDIISSLPRLEPCFS